MSFTILGLSGSLRPGSFNTALLRAAGELAPHGVAVQVYDYSDVPLYREDHERPASVDRLTEALRAADALLLAVPEYNHSLPGVLKNAIDHASRPAFASAFAGLPTGVVSASKSFVGGARGQQHAKNILLGMGTPVFPWPELLVGAAHQKVDAAGRLTDETTRRFLREFTEGFVAWARRQRA